MVLSSLAENRNCGSSKASRQLMRLHSSAGCRFQRDLRSLVRLRTLCRALIPQRARVKGGTTSVPIAREMTRLRADRRSRRFNGVIWLVSRSDKSVAETLRRGVCRATRTWPSVLASVRFSGRVARRPYLSRGARACSLIRAHGRCSLSIIAKEFALPPHNAFRCVMTRV